MNNIRKKPPATDVVLSYGIGDVEIVSNGEIAGFEIDFIGAIQGVKKLPNGWTVKIGDNKILIYSMAKTEITDLLFTYIGELEITSVKFVNWNKEIYYPNYRTLNRNFWKRSTNNWNSDGRKPEEIEDIKLIHKKIAKTKV